MKLVNNIKELVIKKIVQWVKLLDHGYSENKALLHFTGFLDFIKNSKKKNPLNLTCNHGNDKIQHIVSSDSVHSTQKNQHKIHYHYCIYFIHMSCLKQ